VIKYHNKVEDNKMELAKGKRLYNKYEIQKVLNAGGFGITYKAVDMELDRKVVIKEYYPSSIVNRDGTDTVMPFRTHVKIYEKGLENFLDEAKALAKFDTNPNIVNIIEHFRGNGTAYFVMPFEEVDDLAVYIDKHGKMSEKEILDIIFPLLNALQEIHKIGMVHRDIKPANILIRRSDKTPILIDFGTARYAFGKNTKSLSAILTAGYAPIEQYDSNSVQGAYTDVYALGATIYKMATYSVPPESTSRSLAKLKNLADPLKPIKSSDFSLEFKNAVHKALNVMEEDRYRSVEEFRKALGGIERPPKSPKDFKVLKFVGLASILAGALYYPVSMGVDRLFEKKAESKIVDKNDSKSVVTEPLIVENNTTQPVIEEANATIYEDANVSVAEDVNINEVDYINGLMWTSSEHVPHMNWTLAGEYCQDLELGGKSDWRLPTKEELLATVDSCGGTSVQYSDNNWSSIKDKNLVNSSYQSCYKNKGFKAGSSYWSSTSTSISGDTDYAWIAYFNYGYVNRFTKRGSNSVRCVRTGQ
jgi:serine/threonine protein kinase